MFKIISATWLAPAVKRFIIDAPRIANSHKPGHFVIIRLSEDGERIPLTIAHSDKQAGTITLIVQAIGDTTKDLCNMESGQEILDVAGPLGKATTMKKFGHVVLIGGGVGTAVIAPQAAALKDCGNTVTAIIGGRSKEYVILEDELKHSCAAVYPCTDDGSYGFHGLVTAKLQELIDSNAKVDCVITAGPVPMMRAVAETTRPYSIHTVASLNPIMVDGTGMCGGCRVIVGGKTLFACVDGPEFDAHQVDFADLTARLRTYDQPKPPQTDHCKMKKI
ncbi:MAG: sulfide/dihydroorotate dehydrogenase-like FAD/NAD-binding protein [Bdellovibrionota bacterium]|jgi:ferredoxin--NADP+ reductase